MIWFKECISISLAFRAYFRLSGQECDWFGKDDFYWISALRNVAHPGWVTKKILSSRLSKRTISAILESSLPLVWHLCTLFWLNLSVVISLWRTRKSWHVGTCYLGNSKYDSKLHSQRCISWLNFHVRVILTNPYEHPGGHWAVGLGKQSKMRKGKI